MCKLRMSSTLTRCLTRCMIELTPSRLTRVVKKTIARAYYKEINLTRLIRSPICVIILRQMLQAKQEHMTKREKITVLAILFYSDFWENETNLSHDFSI